MSRRATLVVALLLASALSTSTLAMCMADPAAGAMSQMACCKDGHAKCPMHHSGAQSAAQCCQTATQQQQQLKAAEHEIVRLAPASFVQLFAIGGDTLPPVLVHRAPLAAPFKQLILPSTPPYFLATVLLI